jgi:moderate conductance mechanosensitive channel
MSPKPAFKGAAKLDGMNGYLRRMAIFAALLFALLTIVQSVPAGVAAEDKAEISPKIEELLTLLSDPAIQDWLAAQRARPPSPTDVSPADDPAAFLAQRLVSIRNHFSALLAVPGRLPVELSRGWRTFHEAAGDRSPLFLLVLGALCIALGFATRWLHWRMIGRRPETQGQATPGTARDRLMVLWRRLVVGLVGVVAFAASAIGSFMLFDWPAPYRSLVLAIVLAILSVLVVRLCLQALLNPVAEDGAGPSSPFRVIATDNAGASFWTHRIAVAAAVFAFGWAFAVSLRSGGLSIEAVQLFVYLVGVALLGLGLDMVWRHPQPAASAPLTRRNAARWALSLYFLVIWVAWVAGAMNLFWLIVVAGLLPASIRLSRRAVANIFSIEVADRGLGVPSMAAAFLERGLRALFIFAAVMVLAWGWNIDVAVLAEEDTLFARLIAGVLKAIVILLVADLLWQLLKAFIGLQIARAQDGAEAPAEEVQRRSRLRTLLPILRNVLFITIAVIAVLMALSALGVEIGPLIAGAGVVGVAVGFGAQTLVKDIISGMFYLLDDAFRVGEYIESGSFKGTVESFSLRSVKLRHHRGPIFTVPFGELGAIENMSRDWVIDKMVIGITYDSDIEKARKIIKKIGLQLAEDPEFKADVIEPLKMQGVDAFGDSGVQLRLKMMTKPGGQFVMRRRALALIKEAFDENGIKFALPTVTVAGKPSDAETAAAQDTVARLKRLSGSEPATG